MVQQGAEGTITCLSGPGLRFVGEVEGTGTVVCAGAIEANLTVEGLVRITPDALVRGDLRVQAAEIAGTVEGAVTTRGRLTLKATGRVHGDVVTPELVVEAGALLQGQVRMAVAPPDPAMPAAARAA
ncbi:MAG: polymer-forming cytoskeletal protein [Candidatus Methylomirabilales bacterium]